MTSKSKKKQVKHVLMSIKIFAVLLFYLRSYGLVAIALQEQFQLQNVIAFRIRMNMAQRQLQHKVQSLQFQKSTY